MNQKTIISIEIPGEAVPQARPRVTRWGTYDPPRCRAYKEKVGIYAKAIMRGREPLDGPVKMIVTVSRGVPKSWSKKKKAEAMAGTVYPTTKPDIDNILKGLMDALKGIVWRDDAQVISVEASKEYAEHPRVWVHVCKGVEREQDSETKD